MVCSPELQPPNSTLRGNRRTAVIDLVIALAFFAVCYAALPLLDPILRRGRGLAMVFIFATYQFAFEGLAPLLVMQIRHERFSDYGFQRRNLAISLALAFLLAGLYDFAVSLRANALLWIPLSRQPAIQISAGAGFPLSLVGIAVTVATWGFFEGFFGIYFSRKVNQALGHNGCGWFSPGVVGFALFNGCIHLTVHQGIAGFLTSFASGYAIAVIPGVTKNAWGGTLVQTLTNAVGKL